MKISGGEALKNAFGTKPINRHPNREDSARSRDGLLFPVVRPGFELVPGSQVFTMGSCFARNIEAELEAHFTLPTMRFSAPPEEWQGRPNGLLNEYNPASMSQRLLWASNAVDTSEFRETLSGSEQSSIDLLLAVGSPVTRARAIERRREIDAVYANLKSSSVLVITLGLIECWFDCEANVYLNRNPHPQVIRSNPERYRFERLDVRESFGLLEMGISAALDSGVGNILLTVSPVPLQTTFSGSDCVVANSYSKAVLRTVAEMLKDRFVGRLDYFPSYEIALSGGLQAFGDDHVHVRPRVVEKIVQHLRDAYLPESAT